MKLETYCFFTQNQDLEERIDNYSTELRTLASTCHFGNITVSLIGDRISCGTSDPKLRQRLLREADLTLEKCLEISRAGEISKKRSKTITGADARYEVNLREPKRCNKDRPTEMQC